MAKLLQLGMNGEAIISSCPFMRVSKGLTVSRKTAKILAVRRKMDKFLSRLVVKKKLTVKMFSF